MLPRKPKALDGVVISSICSGFEQPASITRMRTLGFSARRPVAALPAVPPPIMLKSNSDPFVAAAIVKIAEKNVYESFEDRVKEAKASRRT